MLLHALVATASLAMPSATHAVQSDSVIVSASWLAHHLGDGNVVIVAIVHSDGEFRLGHIAGAGYVRYDEITTSRDGLWTELPDPAALRALFVHAGVTDDARVVLYSDDPLMASRAFFTLEYLGHRHAAVLNGGLNAWTKSGGRLVTQAPAIREGRLTIHPRPDIVADANWIMSHLKSSGIALVDTRTDEEYQGSGARHNMPSNGHIPGAKQLVWQTLFVDPQAGTFRSPAELKSEFARRAAPGDTVVTYCLVGYRASMTYLVARYLGYPAKLYDGSYQDWAERSLPLTRGKIP
jgi:thiosulfate/3-mercaptopyruvate sulfurtransferase